MSGADRLRAAACAFEITAPASIEAFAEKVDAAARAARAGGADLLVLPEYAAMDIAAALGARGDPGRELAAVTGAAPTLLRLFRATAAAHGLWLLPGTVPMARQGRVVNRAPLITPGGEIAFQDKHVMTRFEDERWGVAAGAPPAVFATPWGRIGIAICFDCEFPALVRAQAEAGAWIVLAPSCTDSLAGYNRVRAAARARAMENQFFVVVAPTVGEAPGLASVDENHGAAAIYGPMDRGFPPDGILAEGALDAPGLVFADLDRAAVDAVRADGAVFNYARWPAPVPPCRLAEAE